MAGFDDRKKGQEAKFVLDAELEFKAAARGHKQLGLWAAAELGLTEDAAAKYALAVISADFEEAGHEDVFRKVRADFDAKDIKISDDDLHAKMTVFLAKAREDVHNNG